MTFAAFGLWCALLIHYDVTRLRLPNVLTLGGAVGILGYATATDRGLVALVGAAILAAVYLLVHVTAPAAMGAGDVKLAIGLGGAAALCGAQAWVLAALLAPVGTAVVGVLLAVRERRRDVPVPHGASMCAATLFAVVVECA